MTNPLQCVYAIVIVYVTCMSITPLSLYLSNRALLPLFLKSWKWVGDKAELCVQIILNGSLRKTSSDRSGKGGSRYKTALCEGKILKTTSTFTVDHGYFSQSKMESVLQAISLINQEVERRNVIVTNATNHQCQICWPQM